jgi:hypothetical protein
MKTLLIQLGNAGEDAGEMDSALRVLWQELVYSGGLEVSARHDPAPANAKSGVAGTISALALTVLESGGVAIALVRVFRDWLMRFRTFSIKLQRGTSTIEISGVNPQDLISLLPQIEQILASSHD